MCRTCIGWPSTTRCFLMPWNGRLGEVFQTSIFAMFPGRRAHFRIAEGSRPCIEGHRGVFTRIGLEGLSVFEQACLDLIRGWKRFRVQKRVDKKERVIDG